MTTPASALHLREHIRAVLSTYVPSTIDEVEGRWNAAVLVLIYEHDGVPHIVFQKRTDKVEAHKGQISFPGGGADPEDADLIQTALRETHEEIGVAPHHIDVLGRLDDMVTISNFRVTPYVGWLSHYPYGWTFSEHEVDYLLEVPIPHLRSDEGFVADKRVINGETRVMPAYRWGDDLIWGATAHMLRRFLDLTAHPE
ncbi:MAG: NUDIX hydrolase [Tepidiformaceae bacterium]